MKCLFNTLKKYTNLVIISLIGFFAILIKIPNTTVFFSVLSASSLMINEAIWETARKPFESESISFKTIFCVILASFSIMYIIINKVISIESIYSNQYKIVIKRVISIHLQNNNYSFKDNSGILVFIFLFCLISFSFLTIISLFISNKVFYYKMTLFSESQKNTVKLKISERLIKLGFNSEDINKFLDNAKKHRNNNIIFKYFYYLKDKHDRHMVENYNLSLDSYNKSKKNVNIENNSFGIKLNEDYKCKNENKYFKLICENVDEIYSIKILSMILIYVS